MPENEGKTYREAAEDTLWRLAAGVASRDDDLAATVAVGYALLAIFDELRAIRERIAPQDTLMATTGIEVQI